ncbi:MAG: TIGR01777 family protein [Saprospiraceae bacterium]|nr:TIGR01777 family protein [Saprospiraceae bacterium]
MNDKKTIWIAGGDGLVGKHLVKMLDKTKFEIFILSRKTKKSNEKGVHYIVWNTEKQIIEDAPIPDHIINLAGAGIADERWSAKRKALLISSRVNSASTIKKYLESHNITPKTYISASAVGFYGHRSDEFLTEVCKPGSEFMSDCCVQWENAAKDTGSLCQRTVILRIGIVLSTLGGALPKMLMTQNLGIFNYFGNGNQYYPWIHIDDLSRLILEAIENQRFKGIYNAVAPQEITNKNMMIEIIQTNQIKGLLIPVPSFSLKLILGEMSAVVLNSNRVSASKLLSEGFHFQFSNAGEAVRDLLTTKK